MKFIQAVLFNTLFSISLLSSAAINKINYPHWDWHNPQAIAQLEKIDAFIEANQHHQPIAVFDWDGTLYGENIPTKEKAGGNTAKPGQAVWHIWAAHNAHAPRYKTLNLYPQYHDCTAPCILQSLIDKETYFEQRTPKQAVLDEYTKNTQISTLDIGMTPISLMKGVAAYEQAYPVHQYAYLPMFDIMQQMINRGFKVWIISGSNPYYLAIMLKAVEKLDPRYNFSSVIGKKPFTISTQSQVTSRIIGNFAKIARGKFIDVYDDRFTPRTEDEPLYTIVGEGKAIAIQRYILKHDKGPLLFAAGNSMGDLEMLQETLKTPESLLIVVNPSEKLAGFIQEKAADRSLILSMQERLQH